MKLRREKVEEIKKKTNYYTTRDLLQKYDEAAPAETPLRHRNPGLQGLPGGVPQTPQFATPQQPQLRPIPNSQTPAKPLDPRLTGTSPQPTCKTSFFSDPAPSSSIPSLPRSASPQAMV
jgi:hypothetical protein